MTETIFDRRTLNEDEKNAIKECVNDTIECMNQIADLQEHMKDNCKALAERLNENIADDDQKIKPALFTKMAKAYIKNKENIEKSKSDIDEVETALHVVFHI